MEHDDTIGERLAESYGLPVTEEAGVLDGVDVLVISNAAALAQPLKEKTVEAFGDGLLHETYGSTEAGVVTNIRPADILRKPGSVGVPFVNTQVKILRDDGSECAVGEM